MERDSAAGRSADARAEELLQEAMNWLRGAQGERITGEVLAKWALPSWRVLHDRALPDSEANVDHLVVTPAGVFVIDSKHYSAAVSEGNGTLWAGRRPLKRELATLRSEAAAVQRVLTEELPDLAVPVHLMFSFTDTPPRTKLVRSQEVLGVAARDLPAQLAARAGVLGRDGIAAVGDALERRLEPKAPPADPASSTGRSDPGGRRRPPPPFSPPFSPPFAPSQSSHSRPSPHRPPPPSPSPASARPASARRRRTPAGRSRRQLVVTLVGGLLAIGLAQSALRALSSPRGQAGIDAFARSLVPAPAGVPTRLGSAPITAPSKPTPAPLQVAWACPGAGRGWTATMTWPASTPAGTLAVQTAPTPAGPWTTARTLFAPAPVALTGLAAGRSEWVRAGSLVQLVMGGAAVTSGEVSASGPC